MIVRAYVPGERESQAICGECGSHRKPVEVGFREVVGSPDFDYPTISAALAAPLTFARATRIEWLCGGFKGENWTQIVRTPFDAQTMTEDEALTLHLRSVEQILLFGHPSSYTPQPYKPATCGGVHYFLGRGLRCGDTIKLRPLRDLVFLSNRQANDADSRIHEWISEFSLEVSPA